MPPATAKARPEPVLTDLELASEKAAALGYRWSFVGSQALSLGAPLRPTVLVYKPGALDAMPYQGATKAAAILNGIEQEEAKRIEHERAHACPTCKGLGWYIVARGSSAGKQICDHGAAQ